MKTIPCRAQFSYSFPATPVDAIEDFVFMREKHIRDVEAVSACFNENSSVELFLEPLFGNEEAFTNAVSEFEEVAPRFIKESGVELKPIEKFECREVKVNDEAILEVLDKPLHEKTYPTIAETFKERVGERPQLDYVVERARESAEKFLSRLKSEEIGRQLIVYDIYTDSFIEYRAVESAQRTAVTLPTDSATLPKLESKLFIVTPFTAAIQKSRKPNVVKEAALELAVGLEEHAEIIEKAKRWLESNKITGREELGGVHSGLITVNPYLSSYMQRVLAKEEGADPHRRPFIYGIGVPRVSLAIAFEPYAVNAFTQSVFKEMKVKIEMKCRRPSGEIMVIEEEVNRMLKSVILVPPL